MEQTKFYQIKNITEHEYTLVGCDGSVITRPIQDIDKSASAFIIQDAKDGDVLYYKSPLNDIEYIVMNRGVNGYGNVDSYFRYNSIEGFGIYIPSVFSAKLYNITPATKEKRDFLFQKMHEAGYEWDTKKKELKKIDNEWVDLGLPSGTLWKSTNEDGYYAYDEAVKTFGDQLPTKKQFEELIDNCFWEWKENGYKVTGPNRNSIFLTALGYRYRKGNTFFVGTHGYYWSSTHNGSKNAWYFHLNSSKVNMYNDTLYCWFSICLVKNK